VFRHSTRALAPADPATVTNFLLFYFFIIFGYYCLRMQRGNRCSSKAQQYVSIIDDGRMTKHQIISKFRHNHYVEELT
jgi:hypothetical protein